jgi:putative salt-induced outer membrane protein YdiY
MVRTVSCAGVVCFLLLAGAWQPAQARDKTDVITLRNGDRVTGEIIQLEYGQLQLSTDDMGTIYIEWDAIAGIDSNYFFDVEQIGGERYSGVLGSTPGGNQVTVSAPGGSGTLDHESVTRISKLESGFWSRIDGSFSAGYSFSKSSDVTVISSGFDATYRGEDIAAALNIDVNSTTSPEQGQQDRDKIAFAYQWLRENRNYWAGLATIERNEELGIDARTQLGGGFGRYIHQTSHSEVTGFVGATYTREWVTGDEDGQDSAEGVLGGTWRIYRLNTPKTTLTSQIVLYPSLTENDRYRGTADVSLRKEIIKDFFFELSFYYDYDSQPPGEATAKDDYSITTSLGYTF